FYIAYTSDCASAPRRSMHAAGIQLDHALLVRQPTQANAVIVRIILWTFHHAQCSIQRVATVLEERVCIVQILATVSRTNDDGSLGRAHVHGPPHCGVLRFGVLSFQTKR